MPRHASTLLLSVTALLLASCRPQVVVEVKRADRSTFVSLLACPSCELAKVFSNYTDDSHTVGLSLERDEPRQLELTLFRSPGDACDVVTLNYQKADVRLVIEVPADSSERVSCSGADCAVSADCKVTLPAPYCDADTCPDGCCDDSELCHKERVDERCGPDGRSCKDCTQIADTCDLSRQRCAKSCRDSGEQCSDTSDCCSDDAKRTCLRGVCEQCSSRGYSCYSQPCCDGLACNDGFCGPTTCVQGGATCSLGDACCTGYQCESSRCTACGVEGSSCGYGGVNCCDGLECNYHECITQGSCGRYGEGCSTYSGACCEPWSCNYESYAGGYICN